MDIIQYGYYINSIHIQPCGINSIHDSIRVRLLFRLWILFDHIRYYVQQCISFVCAGTGICILYPCCWRYDAARMVVLLPTTALSFAA